MKSNQNSGNFELTRKTDQILVMAALVLFCVHGFIKHNCIFLKIIVTNECRKIFQRSTTTEKSSDQLSINSWSFLGLTLNIFNFFKIILKLSIFKMKLFLNIWPFDTFPSPGIPRNLLKSWNLRTGLSERESLVFLQSCNFVKSCLKTKNVKFFLILKSKDFILKCPVVNLWKIVMVSYHNRFRKGSLAKPSRDQFDLEKNWNPIPILSIINLSKILHNFEILQTRYKAF